MTAGDWFTQQDAHNTAVSWLSHSETSRVMSSHADMHECIDWYESHCPVTVAHADFHAMNQYEIRRHEANMKTGSTVMDRRYKCIGQLPRHLRDFLLQLQLGFASDSERLLFKLTWG